MRTTALQRAVRRSMLVIGIAGGITILGAGIAASTATADEQAPRAAAPVSGQTAGDDDETSGEDGTGSGNQAEADVDAPVDASDNQVTVIGDENESSRGDSEPRAEASPTADVDHTSGEDGTLSGNQVEADVDAPVEVSGNQLTVIGDENRSEGSASGGDCQPGGSDGGDTTSGEDGTLAGNQVDLDADAPVDVTGNQVTVIGDENRSEGSASGGDCQSGGSDGGDTTSGEDGTLAGNQVDVDADAPVDVTGNQVTVIGDGNQSGGSTESGGSEGGSDGGDTTSGEDGNGSGNQLTLDPDAPVDLTGNQVTVIGNDNDSGDPGHGDGPGEGDGDGDGDGDGEVAGVGSGGPGSPGTSVLSGLDATTALPQTGVAATSGMLGLAGLVMLLAGLGLVVVQRRRGMPLQ